MALGLKCGGTLEERASRLFSTKGKGLNELDPTLFAKSKGKASTAHRSAKELEKNREIAAMEAQVYRFAEILSEQRAATKENVERKQARTELEREDSDEDESGKIFSLKKFSSLDGRNKGAFTNYVYKICLFLTTYPTLFTFSMV